MTCHTCKNWICETVRVFGGTWAVWKCPKRRIEFGVERDWMSGKNQPKSCVDYAK